MDPKERRKKMTDLALDQEDIDRGIDMINLIMTSMVDDNVTSNIGQIMYMFNAEENVWVSNSAPVVMPDKTPPDEMPGPTQMVGFNIQFADLLQLKKTQSAAFGVRHKVMISSLTLLKKELEKEQKVIERKLDALMKK